jgi:hypothetical protein
MDSLMNQTQIIKSPKVKKEPRCLSCGNTLRARRRRYCSKDCRQELEKQLNLAVGLLNTLNARFATFSFTNSMLYLHVLPNRSREVLSYLYMRMPYRKPAQDLWDMIEGLGTAWHKNMKQTRKRYLATRHVLEQAKRNGIPPYSVMPLVERRPAFRRKSLHYLKLTTAEVLSPQAKHTIKTAYRREVKIHHPDHGGNPAFFRQLHDAHLELANWIRHPRFTTHRGIPEKWSYDSERRKKWLPPALPRKGSGNR